MREVSTSVSGIPVPDNWPAAPPTKRAPGWRALLQIAVVVIGLAVLLPWVATEIRHLLGRPPKHFGWTDSTRLLGTLAMLAVVAAIVLLVHECGHVAGAAASGWQLESIFVGPLRLMRDELGLRVRYHEIFLFYGGVAICAPRDWRGDEPARREFRRMVAAGPLASLVVGLLVLAALGWSHAGREWRTSTPIFFLSVAGAMSVGIGLVTLLPVSQPGGLRNDGLQWWLLRRRDRNGLRTLDSQVRAGMLTLIACTRRPREWSTDVVAQLPALPGNHRAALEYYRALDVDDVAGAATSLGNMLAEAAATTTVAAAALRASAALEASLFEALWRGDAAAARAWRDRAVDGDRHDAHGWWLSAAAVASAERDEPAARAALERARAAITRRSFARIDLLRAAAIDRLAARLA